MAFAHEESCICMKSELDLFSVPPTQTSVENGTWVEYHPITTLTENSPIEFDIPSSGEDYVDFANSYLHVKAKIVKGNGENLAADDVVAPTNLWLHSLFSQVDVSLNGTQITSSTNTYPYRAMIETLLTYGGDAKQSQLTSALFYKDTAGKMDTHVLDGEVNDGFVKRAAFTSRSKTVDMIGRLHADIFFQERYMLNEVNTKLKLHRARDTFSIHHNGAFKVVILSAVLYIRKIKLMPSVFLAQAKTLETSNAKYPVRRVVCKSFTIPIGFLDASHEKVFSGQLPSRLVIGLVENSSYNGHKQKNPFNFQNFKLTEIGVYTDGQQQLAVKPLKLNFENAEYISAYHSLFSGCGKVNNDEGNFIDRKEFSDGYCLYAFDLSPDLKEDDHYNLIKEGSLRLVLKFAEALTTTVSVIVYGEFENVIEVDRNRNIIHNFS